MAEMQNKPAAESAETFRESTLAAYEVNLHTTRGTLSSQEVMVALSRVFQEEELGALLNVRRESLSATLSNYFYRISLSPNPLTVNHLTELSAHCAPARFDEKTTLERSEMDGEFELRLRADRLSLQFGDNTRLTLFGNVSYAEGGVMVDDLGMSVIGESKAVTAIASALKLGNRWSSQSCGGLSCDQAVEHLVREQQEIHMNMLA